MNNNDFGNSLDNSLDNILDNSLDNSLDKTQQVSLRHDPIKDFLDTNPTIYNMVQKIKNDPIRMSTDDKKRILEKIEEKIELLKNEGIYHLELLDKLKNIKDTLKNLETDAHINQEVKQLRNKINTFLSLSTIQQQLQQLQQQQQQHKCN